MHELWHKISLRPTSLSTNRYSQLQGHSHASVEFYLPRHSFVGPLPKVDTSTIETTITKSSATGESEVRRQPEMADAHVPT